MAQERKIGVFICYCGGNISDYVDVEQVRDEIAREPGVVIAKTHMFTCSDAAQQEMIDDIKTAKLDGLVVAGYFVFLELTHGQVKCGPSDTCGPVQNSSYAKLFGVIPMGRFGFVGYITILIGWLLWQYGPTSLKKLGSLSMWGFCVFGVLFSAYLTFLEPCIIGSTCMWCITSAVIMTVLLLASTPAAQRALAMSDEEELLPNSA